MHLKTAKQLQQDFLNSKVSAEQIVRYFFKRIEDYDPQVGAFLSIFPDRALNKARALDAKKSRNERLGKLAAIPIGLKDNIHLKGELTTCASKFLVNYRAVFDATVSQFIEEEDGIILGKLNLDEFAMGSSTEHSALKQTNNPWDLDAVPGGSSGGSAAAVAAGLCSIALGSETGGSVRHPAACCGCYGFKPTYGRVSRFGLVAFGSSLDQIGPVARSMEDIGLIMEVIGKHDPNDATSLTQPHNTAEDYVLPVHQKRIGIPRHLLDTIGSAGKEAFEKALSIYEKLGHTLVDVKLSLIDAAVATYYIIATAEASTNLARFDGIRYGVRAKEAKTLEEVYVKSRTQGFGTEVKRRIMLGTYVLSAGFQDAYYKQATRVRAKMIEEFDSLFEECDVIATPTIVAPAFKRGSIQDPLEMYLQDLFTIPASLCKLPAISHPTAFINGMPYGMQLMGPRKQDALVCRLAHAYERATSPIAFPPLFNKQEG